MSEEAARKLYNKTKFKELIRGADGKLREATTEDKRRAEAPEVKRERKAQENLQAQRNMDRLTMSSEAFKRKWGVSR